MNARTIALGVVALAATAGVSKAGTTGFSFSVISSEAARSAAGVSQAGPNPIGGNAGNATANTPFILLSNSLESTLEISSFSFTLVSGKVFDFSVKENVYGGGFGWEQVSPGPVDTNTGGTTPDGQSSAELRYDFGAGFGAGDRFSSQLDIDPGSLTDVQLRAALQGAVVSVRYEDESMLSAVFGPSVTSTTYTVSGSSVAVGLSTVAVPLPSSFAGGMAVLPMGLLRRRRDR